MSLCEKCGWDHEIIRKKCRESLFQTARVLCNFPDLTPNFHGRICGRVRDNLDSNRLNMLFLLPRGHLKTHMMTLAGAVWFIIRNPEVRILLVQQSETRSVENMQMIETILDSELFKHYYPDIKLEKATDVALRVTRKGQYPEPTVTGKGVTSKVVGGHYDIIILDDVIDLEAAESEAVMDTAFKFYKHMPFLFARPTGCVEIVIGTRWGNGDLYEYVKELGTHDIIEAGIYADERCAEWDFNEFGKPVWPERFTEEVIAERRKRVNDEFVWACQYLLRPISDEVARFPESCFQYYTWREVNKSLVLKVNTQPPRVVPVMVEEVVDLESLPTYMTVDPSIGETKTADPAAIVVSKVDSKGRIFVVEDWADRVNPITLIERIFTFQEKWNPRSVGIESVAFQKALQYFLKQEMRKRGKAFRVDELKVAGRAKEVRIEGLSPYFINRQVWISEKMQRLKRQLANFPASTKGHDDDMDALAHHVPYWRTGRAEKVKKQDDDLEDWTNKKPDGNEALYGLAC